MSANFEYFYIHYTVLIVFKNEYIYKMKLYYIVIDIPSI